ncbi:MAG: hypothetical protein JST16_03010 [Bdellovibrionales bacterium]|nr:hypothetical protein [Bdellovibrionales bacterium]
MTSVLPGVAWATPQVIRVDGSVFDSAGAPVTASKDIQIKAYDAASGGTLLWTSSVYNTSVSSGRFTINLDAAAGSPSLVDRLGERTPSQAIYFQIEVDSGAANGSMDTPTIVLPRIRAKGTAFALNAASADALRGVTATTSEINYLAGATANVQTQINTLASAGGAADYSFTSVTGNVAAIAGTAYITTGTALVGVTLPSTCALGDKIKILGYGSGGWSLVPTGGMSIMDGAGGVLTSTYTSEQSHQSGEFFCAAANSAWFTSDAIACVAGSQVFTYTGSDQNFTIPNGCSTVRVKMWGAGGGGSLGTGGGGGFVSGTLAVTSGEALTVIVGQGGASSGSTTTYGGGGSSIGSSGGINRGSGGGRSALRRSSTELMTAGGGGGGAGWASATNGGAAGGTTGSAGANYPGGAVGGAAGSSSSGGSGGSGYGGYSAGTSGSQYAGGNGGNGAAGGGGGGGYYGGGGGGGGTNSDGGAGGGGGSSYTGSATSAANTAASGVTPGNNSDSDYSSGIGVGGAASTAGGNGRVVISYP